MATAKKMKSGNFRVQVFDYTDESGKRHYKSFTAATKKEAEYAATEYLSGRKKKDTTEDITIGEAIDRYIKSKEGVLSPSTIRGYYAMKRNYYGDISGKYIRSIDNTTLQIWASTLSAKVSPKTVRNAFMLLNSSLEMFLPDFHIKVTLPAKKKPALYVPSDRDIKALIKHIDGTELEIAVLLAAFGPMRRGEICALESSDIKGNIVTVSKSMVMGEDKEWHVKQPKTYGGYREIEFPNFVIDKMKGIEGRIIKAYPDQISNRFRRAIKFSGLPHFRFHDLRHYSASIMHAIGVPDQYIMARGGWSSDSVMKTVYRNVIDLESVKQNKKISKHFEKLHNDMENASNPSKNRASR